MKFKKAPAYMGKVLTLFVGNGDKRIMDDEVLEGLYWQKFVDMGFLVRDDEDVESVPAPVKYEPKAEPTPEVAPTPVPAPVKYESKSESVSDPDPEPDPELKGTMTKSGADKMAKVQGARGISTSTKHKGKRRRK